MTAGADAADEVHRWIREAEEELAVSRYLECGADIPLRSACFHAHLAAEKALKAQLVSEGVDFPRIHDLLRLQDLSPVDPGVDPDDLDLLDPWAMAGRYPADLPEPTPEHVREVVEAAGRVVGAIATSLGPPPGT